MPWNVTDFSSHQTIVEMIDDLDVLFGCKPHVVILIITLDDLSDSL